MASEPINRCFRVRDSTPAPATVEVAPSSRCGVAPTSSSLSSLSLPSITCPPPDAPRSGVSDALRPAPEEPQRRADERDGRIGVSLIVGTDSDSMAFRAPRPVALLEGDTFHVGDEEKAISPRDFDARALEGRAVLEPLLFADVVPRVSRRSRPRCCPNRAGWPRGAARTLVGTEEESTAVLRLRPALLTLPPSDRSATPERDRSEREASGWLDGLRFFDLSDADCFGDFLPVTVVLVLVLAILGLESLPQSQHRVRQRRTKELLNISLNKALEGLLVGKERQGQKRQAVVECALRGRRERVAHRDLWWLRV